MVHPVTITVSTPLLTNQAVRLVPKKADGWVLRTMYSPSLGVSWSTTWLAKSIFGELGQRGRLQGENAGVRAVIGVDHPGVGDGQSQSIAGLGQQPPGAVYGLSYVAATELVGIGETVDKIDDQQGGAVADSAAVAKALLLIDFQFTRYSSWVSPGLQATFNAWYAGHLVFLCFSP